MDDESLTVLLASAMLKSACASAKCRVSYELHRWFVDVVHLEFGEPDFDSPPDSPLDSDFAAVVEGDFPFFA